MNTETAKKSGVISVKEISIILQIGKNQAYELVQTAYLKRDKYFPVFKIGSNYKIPKQPFYKWLNNSDVYCDL